MQGESDNEVRGWARARVINNNQFVSDILNKFEYTPHSVSDDKKNKAMWGEGMHAVEKSPRIASSNSFLPIWWIDEISVSSPEAGLAWDFFDQNNTAEMLLCPLGPRCYESWQLLLSLWWISDDSCEEVQDILQRKDAWRGPEWWDITCNGRPLEGELRHSKRCSAKVPDMLSPNLFTTSFFFFLKDKWMTHWRMNLKHFLSLPICLRKCSGCVKEHVIRLFWKPKIVSLIYHSIHGSNKLLEKLFWLLHYPSGCVRTHTPCLFVFPRYLNIFLYHILICFLVYWI